MSAIPSVVVEERTARALRTAIDPVVPPMSLDPSALLHTAKRHRSRRTAAVSTVLTLAAGVLVAGGLHLSGASTDQAIPAKPDQQPHAIGPDQVAEIAPGIMAVNRPDQRTLADGTVVVDFGMTTTWPMQIPAERTLKPLAMVVYSASLVDWNAAHPAVPGPRADRAVALGFTDGSKLSPVTTAPMVWTSRGNVPDYSAGGVAEDPNGSIPLADGSMTYAGHVPRWIPDPRVVLYSPRGFLLADNTISHSLDVPTYLAPTNDGSLLYTVRILNDRNALPTAVGRQEPMVALIVGSDGSVFTGLSCQRQTAASCEAMYGPGLLAAAGLDALGQPLPAAAQATVPAWVSAYPSTPTVKELAPGFTAAVQPSLSRLDDGRYLANTGLAGNGYLSDQQIGVVQIDTDWINYSRGPSEPTWTGDAAVAIAFDSTLPPRFSGMPFAWSSHEQTIDWYLPQGRTAHVMQFGSAGTMGNQQDIAGVAPAGMTDPTLDLCYTPADGTGLTCLRDVPMFRAPTADGRPMFVVRFDPSLGYDDSHGLAYGLVFTDRSTGLQVPFLACQASEVDPANPAIPAVAGICVPPTG